MPGTAASRRVHFPPVERRDRLPAGHEPGEEGKWDGWLRPPSHRYSLAGIGPGFQGAEGPPRFVSGRRAEGGDHDWRGLEQSVPADRPRFPVRRAPERVQGRRR